MSTPPKFVHSPKTGVAVPLDSATSLIGVVLAEAERYAEETALEAKSLRGRADSAEALARGAKQQADYWRNVHENVLMMDTEH